eukprot:1140723-Pleurochrysis_carterae.AAC.3
MQSTTSMYVKNNGGRLGRGELTGTLRAIARGKWRQREKERGGGRNGITEKKRGKEGPGSVSACVPAVVSA